VRSAVERHGGIVWVDAAPGEGARFYFTLPLA
jgi:signal transduction histidine kinase